MEAFENPKHYKKFQAAIVSDYAPNSTVEYELVLRTASLLWRPRRATVVETGLLEIQAMISLRRSEHFFGTDNHTDLYRRLSLPKSSGGAIRSEAGQAENAGKKTSGAGGL